MRPARARPRSPLHPTPPRPPTSCLLLLLPALHRRGGRLLLGGGRQRLGVALLAPLLLPQEPVLAARLAACTIRACRARPAGHVSQAGGSWGGTASLLPPSFPPSLSPCPMQGRWTGSGGARRVAAAAHAGAGFARPPATSPCSSSSGWPAGRTSGSCCSPGCCASGASPVTARRARHRSRALPAWQQRGRGRSGRRSGCAGTACRPAWYRPSQRCPGPVPPCTPGRK